MKVLSVGGFSQSGKTTTVINLTEELKKRGYRVVTIKDIHFQNFTMETEGSDSWKHWQASEDVVFARGQEETYQIWHKKLSLREMLEHLSADYVIVEGMKSFPLPHILCASSFDDLEKLLDDTTFAASGILANEHNKYKNLRIYDAKKEVKELADLVEEKVFEVLPYANPECCQECGMTCAEMCTEILKGNKKREDCVMDNKEKIEVTINDKKITMVPFVQNMIYDVIIGMLQNLKGFEKGDIRIEINNK